MTKKKKNLGQWLDAIIEYRDSGWWIVALVLIPAIVISTVLTLSLYFASRS
jgi:hypothetical protein